MRKILLFTLLLSVIVLVGMAQTPGIEWNRSLGGSSGDTWKQTLVTSDSNLLVAMESFSNNGDVTGAHGVTDIWIAKLNQQGNTLWSRTLGGSNQDYFTGMYNMPDGGVMVVGNTLSSNGDVSGYHGNYDVWVVRLSATGSLLWQKCIGGSTSDYFLQGFVQADGSFVMVGNSFSTDGDFTANHGSSDIYVIKLDNSGNIVWQRCIGGTNSDVPRTVVVKPNGNWLIAGNSLSNDGDVSTNKGSNDIILAEVNTSGSLVWARNYGGSATDNCIALLQTGVGQYSVLSESTSTNGDVGGAHGMGDCWVLTVNDGGTPLWQRDLGGSNIEHGSNMFYNAIDNNIVIECKTASNDGDVSGNHGDEDIWIAKLSNAGTLLWQRCLGGSFAETFVQLIYETSGYLDVFSKNYSSDGDATGHHGTSGSDLWLVRLTPGGTIEWQKNFGGSLIDAPTPGQGFKEGTSFTVLGYTTSNDGDVQGEHYKSDTLVGDTSTTITYYGDYWLLNINSDGTLNWQRALGGFNDEQPGNVVVINGKYFISGITYSNNGDVSRNHGNSDCWLVKLGTANTIKGNVFLDKNSNGIKDTGEPNFDGVTIKVHKNGFDASTLPYNGYFYIDVDTGTYVSTVQLLSNYFSVVPASHSSSFSTYYNTDSFGIAIQPVPNEKDILINLYAIDPARPGFNVRYKLIYKNVGTVDIPSGTITLVTDPKLSYVSASTAPTASGHIINWNYTNLNSLDTAGIVVTLNLAASPTANIGDTLHLYAMINPITDDVTPRDDTARLKQIVVGSYDPNDKTEANAGIITPAQVSNGDYLNYLIRFQNTGTDTAFNVIVRDTLESRLDWSTLQMVSASHPYQLTIEGDNKLSWQFNGIKLPFDEPSSHGYIAYRIKPLSTVHAGDTIKNTAGIYFDFNLPVATNINKTIVFLPSSALPVTLISFDAAQAGSIVNVSWKTSAELNAKYFEVQRSANGIDFTTIGTVPAGNTTYLFKDYSPIAGYNYYRLKPVDIDGRFTYSTIVMVNMKSGAEVISSLYPNPGNGNVTLKLQGTVQGNVMVQVLDQQGREVTTKQFGVQNTGEFKTPLDLGKISKGSYVLRIVVDKKVYLQKLLIQ